MRNRILLFTLILCSISLGFLRDGLKKNTNQEIYFHKAETNYSNLTSEKKNEVMIRYQKELTSSNKWLHDCSLQQLQSSKWLATGAFSSLYFILIIFIVQLIFKKSYFKKIAFAYLVAIIISFGIYIFGYFLNSIESSYLIARRIMGVIQSPIPLFLIIPAIYLYHQQIQFSNNKAK